MDNRKVIYLDDALEAIRKLPNAGIHWFVSAEAVFDALLKLPSAQPEIIRCKDCKHYVLRELFGRSFGLCERLCNESHSILTESNDFCSHAERRKQ